MLACASGFPGIGSAARFAGWREYLFWITFFGQAFVLSMTQNLLSASRAQWFAERAAKHAKRGVLPLILAALGDYLERAHSAKAARIASAAPMSPTLPLEADRRHCVGASTRPTCRREDQHQWLAAVK